MRLRLSGLAVFLALATAGCTTYAPLPLPEKPDLTDAVPPQATEPLDMNTVATVAVLNNPDLRSARAKAKIDEAQAFAAGILPNPQLDASTDLLTNQPAPGLSNGYGLGLSYDIQALITQSAKVGAADAARDQARLDLLWQEWQTVAQARTLYVQRIANAEKRDLYAAAEDKYAAQSGHSDKALQAGDVTFDQAAVDLAALLDARSQLRTTERSLSQTDYTLRALLGVSPQTDVRLRPLMLPPIPDKAAVEAAIAKVAQTRPDLRALQAGYQSQEETLRKSVLSQFPSLSLGVTKASDTTNVHTLGLGATLDLPLFDRNQGDIAVQSATREQLRAEYQARLDQATGDAWRIWTEMGQLNMAIGEIEARLPDLQTGADNAGKAYESGDLPVLTYVTLESAVLARRSELSDLKQSLWNDAIALSTVLGTQIEPNVDAKEPMP